MPEFRPPSGANKAIREHLVTSAEIARRTGVTKQAVSQWIGRHRSLAELVIVWIGSHNPVFWWPQVEAELERLGLPGRRYAKRPATASAVAQGPEKPADEQRPSCGQTRGHEWRTFTCSRPEGHDGNHVDKVRRAIWTGDSPATDLEGRPLLKGTIPPSKSDPRAFRRRRAAAARRDT